jgi:DMSO/TMAO reductase YedYZ molybdopterin-dependent catalytic subunit
MDGGFRKSLHTVPRRDWLRALGAAAGGVALANILPTDSVLSQEPSAAKPLPNFTGPGQNPYWNSVGSIVSEPQKAPLLLLTDRPVQLETPRRYFLSAFTPNEAFYVRWHLDRIPNAVNLKTWRLRIAGSVSTPLSLSLPQLMSKFSPETVAAVNQCSGNSRSRFQPRLPGAQWGNGAMGNALWTGVRLRDLLAAAGVKTGSLQLQFQGLELGEGPEGYGSRQFLKSLNLDDPVIDDCLVAYSMNGEPLPMLNGFPVRLVVPGYFATYWMKCLSFIRVLDKPDENFWMKTAYRIPDTPRGTTTPQEVGAGTVKTIPINRMPVRSFLVSPDGDARIPSGMTVQLKGIAFSGYGRVTRVEVSSDNLKSWQAAQLGDDHGPYSFRTWKFPWKAPSPGRHTIALRAADEKGNVQLDEPIWNPGGYLWNRIERQEFAVGTAE